MSNPTLTQRGGALGAKPTPPPLAKPPKRMTLESITDGPRPAPWAILVYGPEGVGKTSLALDLDDAVTVDVEQSANRIKGKKFPVPHSLQDVYDAIEILYSQDHRHRRLVIDGVDRLEALIHQHVVKAAKSGQIQGIEDFGYGKGYQVALDEWRRLVARLDELRSVRNMDILLLGHTYVRPFKNPEGPDYDRYVLRLHEKSGSFIKEWCDAVLFLRFEESTTKVNDREKGVLTGARLLHTRRSAAFDAKNRFDLPDPIQLPDTPGGRVLWNAIELATKKEA